MAVGIRPPPERNRLGKALTIGGAAVGGAFGGAPGALAGASAGGTAASLVQKAPQAPIETQGMTRRQDTLGGDPLRSIAEARAALQGLPPEQFPEVRKAFEQAMLLAQRNQELGAQGRV